MKKSVQKKRLVTSKSFSRIWNSIELQLYQDYLKSIKNNINKNKKNGKKES
jgi:hypothetical protein